MSAITIIKRRLTSKIHPVLKRVLLPMGALLLVLHVITWTDDSPEITSPEVLPGEALDPLAKSRHRHSKDHRESNAFETVLRSAATVDAQEDLAAGDKIPVEEKHYVAEDGKRHNETLRLKKAIENKKEFPKINVVEKKDNNREQEIKDKRKDDWSMSKLDIPGKDKVRFQGHRITDRTVTLTVMSSADKVFMSLNKREIYRGLEDRGMHVVVLHPHTGKVMAARVFDTFFNGTEEEMVSFLDDLQPGRVVVFAIRDEAASGLTWKGRSKLKELGARFADQLKYRDMWVLVTKVGGLKLAESFSNVAMEDTSYEWGGPLFLRTDFELEETSDNCKWGKDYLQDMRQRFCQRFEGYGDLCKCSITNFEDIFLKSDPKVVKELSKNSLHKDLAVAILASDRPDYLYRTLKSLREAAGFRADRVVVFTERENRQVAALVKLFSVQLVVIGRRVGAANATVTQLVRDKVQYVFSSLMGATFSEDKIPAGIDHQPEVQVLSTDHLVILEDDLQVSGDFFKYMYSMAPVLKRDPTIVGISGFNYNSYNNVANSLTASYRTHRVQTLALMLTRAVVNEYLVNNWPAVESEEPWHHGLEDAMGAKRNLAMVYPEISRCKHFGYRGYRIKGSLQKAFFDGHKTSLTTNYEITQEEIYRLEMTAYNEWELNLIKKSDPASFNFCQYSFTYGEKPLVVFVNFNGRMSDDAHLIATLKCLGAWHLYGEGHWKGTWHFHYHGHSLTLVAVPASQHSHLMPADYKFADMTGPENEKPSP